MKKLKKIWQENSVLLVLLVILIACLIAISVVVVKYFVGANESKYGERLEDIDKHEFKEEDQKNVITKMQEDKTIESVSMRFSGKTIYIDVKFKAETNLSVAQGSILKSLEYFNEEILNYYDLQFMINAEKTENSAGFKIMGSHNVSGTGGIVWNNNTEVKEEE